MATVLPTSSVDVSRSLDVSQSIEFRKEFFFRRRNGKLDWRKLVNVNLERVVREVGFVAELCGWEGTDQVKVRRELLRVFSFCVSQLQCNAYFLPQFTLPSLLFFFLSISYT